MDVNAALDMVAADGSSIDRDVIVDSDVYELERQRIFARKWVVVAHESQIALPGSFVSSWIGEDPVLVSRSRSGEVHVVLNSCSHRASRVCRVDTGSTSSWTCPNHGWQFSNTGRLLGVPHSSDGYGPDLDRSQLGLVTARTEVRYGLVFATFGSDVALDEHLGDSGYYLETIFDRYTDGVEMLEGTMRSIISCNWKLAMENLGTDLQHPEFAHGAFMDLWPDPVMEFMEGSEQILTSAGHPMCIGRRPPPYTEAEEVLPGISDRAERRIVQEWFDKTNQEAENRLGRERANLYVFTGSVFPNLSFLPGVSAVFLLHPKGPTQTEWWSWCLVPVGAPAEVIRARRQRFMLTCGPGGMILAEDAENWADMTRACSSEAGRRLRLRIDRGLGEEYQASGLPGDFAPMRSEHVQRGFWRNWRRAMESVS